jgi:tetratricopeptide (TPR) repeat protein
MHKYETFARRIRRFGLCLAAAGSISAVADADEVAANGGDPCTESSTARDPEAARVAFRAGQTAFSEGGYARAVELWKQAYGDDCTAHALLLNLAMAEELLGRPDDAIHTLTLFNKRSPSSPYVDANVKRIQRLQLTAAGTRDGAMRGRELSIPADRPTSDEDGLELSLPLVVSVAGGAVAAVGTVLFFEGRASAGSAEERCRGPRQACGDVDGAIDGERARARAQVGGWMAGAGLVTTAGGLVWHFLVDAPTPLDQRATGGFVVSADVPSHAASVTWSGAF